MPLLPSGRTASRGRRTAAVHVVAAAHYAGAEWSMIGDSPAQVYLVRAVTIKGAARHLMRRPQPKNIRLSKSGGVPGSPCRCFKGGLQCSTGGTDDARRLHCNGPPGSDGPAFGRIAIRRSSPCEHAPNAARPTYRRAGASPISRSAIEQEREARAAPHGLEAEEALPISRHAE
jgi:hypothetical protein